MRTKIVKVGKTNIAFGLSWSSLRGVGKQAQELRALVKSNNAEKIVQIELEGSPPVIGLLSKQRSNPKGVVSGAALFASLCGFTNAMFAYRFEDGTCAFIGVQNGMPMPGFDLVGSQSEIESQARDFLDLNDGVRISLLGNIEIGEVPSPLDPEGLLAVDKAVLSKAALKSAKPPTKQLGVAVAIICIAFAGFQQFTKWQQEQKRKAMAQQQAPVDPNIQYRAMLPGALENAGFAARGTAQDYFATVGKLPMFHAGWKLHQVACFPGGCKTTWKRDGGTFEDFDRRKSSLPGVQIQAVQYEADLETLHADFPLTMPVTSRGQKENELPRVEGFLSILQNYNQANKSIGLEIKRKEEAPSVLALPPNVAPTALTSPVMVGGWEMNIPHYQRSVITTLPNNMTLDQVKFLFSDVGVTLFSEGKYYAKN